jgi:hypothetical protein
LDSPPRKRHNFTQQKRPTGKKVEVQEYDLTRVRIMDWLLSNMHTILNIIKSNSQRKKEEQSNIYGTHHKNSDDAENMIAHCIFLVKLLEDFELVYVFFKIYGLTLQLNNKVSKSIHVFEILRDLAYEIKDPVYVMESYRYLGLAH